MFGAVLAIGASGGAGATGLAQIVHARKEHFRDLGRQSKYLRDQIDRSHPNWNRVMLDTNRIEQLAAALPNWFPAGSGKGHGVGTRARRKIWTRPQAFARAAQNLLNSAQNLRRDATGHDLRALRLDTRVLGRACDSCHRSFRAHSSWW